MKLKFIGTRGYHELRTSRHALHTALEVSHGGRSVQVDCGEDWLGRFEKLKPKAIVLTHAHPDHAHGLKDGAPCPVYATPETWQILKDYPITDRRIIEHRKPLEVRGITFEAFPVEHSTTCPAVGFRISAGRACVFYAPDLIYIEDRAAALAAVSVFIGDGATVTQSFVRRQGKHLIGHATVRTQIGWCAKVGVPHMIVTHCGREIVGGDEQKIENELREIASARGVELLLAYDGLDIKVGNTTK